MAETCFFSSDLIPDGSEDGAFNFDWDYRYQEELLDEEPTVSSRGDEST